jgi:serine-type D-Ala-D-Ala carboxypeptidase
VTREAASGGGGFRDAAALLDRGVREKAYSAAVLLAARGEEVALHAAAGEAHLSSVFDIASVTKPLVAALFFVLAQDGTLSLDGRLADVLPVRSPDPAAKTIRLIHLLSHTSGLPAWKRLYKDLRAAEGREGRRLRGTAEGHDRIVDAVLSMPLEHPPGTRSVYSDLGYIVLGRAIEVAAFRSLDRLLQEALARPLGMRDTAYRPLAALSECETGRLVSTGFSEERGREKAGEVDDENAAAMGGVAGHAGIFATAHDLFLFSREFLRALRGEGRILSRPSALRMGRRAEEPPGCPRTPGWDTPTSEADGGSQAGRRFSGSSVGHLGFTGCSLWIDLEREITIALLTNRVRYGEQSADWKTIRPAIHDAVMEEVLRT